MKVKVLNSADDPYIKKLKESIQKKTIEFLNPPRQSTIQSSLDYIPFGNKNLAPQEFAQLSREVSDHRSIINSKVRYTNGVNIVSENEETQNFIDEIQLHDVVSKRMLHDEYSIGATVIELVYPANKEWLKIYHIESVKCRLKTDLTGVIWNPNWMYRATENDVEIPFYPEFIIDEDGLYHSCFYKGEYEPEFIYGIPSWYAGLRNVKISGLTEVMNESQLENGFFKDGILLAPVEDPKDKLLLEKKINKVDSGAENASGIMVAGLPTSASGDTIPKPEFIDLRMDFKGAFMDLDKNSSDKLLRVHSWYRTLAGFVDSTGFDTDRILNEYKIALTTSIEPKQEEYLKLFIFIFKEFGIDTTGMKYENKSPINPIADKLKNMNDVFMALNVDPESISIENEKHMKIIEKLL